MYLILPCLGREKRQTLPIPGVAFLFGSHVNTYSSIEHVSDECNCKHSLGEVCPYLSEEGVFVPEVIGK